MANTSKGTKGKQAKAEAKAKATFVRSARQPFRPGCHGADAWAEVWPKLRAGKAITMADMVAAWDRVIVARGLSTAGNTQSAKARAQQFVQARLSEDLLAHTEQAGVYVLGSKYPLPDKKEPKAKAKADHTPVEAVADAAPEVAASM